MIEKMIGIIIFFTFVSAICLAGEINIEKIEKQRWINFETTNFNVLTNAKERKAKEITQELENFLYFLSRTMGVKQWQLPKKVPVVAAKDKSSFLSLGIPTDIAGLFLTKPDNTIFARVDSFKSASKGGSNMGRSVVFHELVHLFLHNAPIKFANPLWFDEGIAEYLGGYTEKKDRVIIGELGMEANRFVSILQFNGLFESVDTNALFKTTRKDLNLGENASEKEREFTKKFYCRSLAVVHYMYSDPVRMKQLYQYLYLLKQEVAADKAFQYVFHKTYKELDEEVNKYISRYNLTGLVYRIGKNGLKFPKVETIKHDITKKDVMAFLYSKISMISLNLLGPENISKMHADIEKFYPGLAEKIIQEQLSKNPNDPFMHLRMALIYQNLNRHEDAINLYEKTLLIDGSESIALNNLAWLLATVPDKTLRDPQRAISLAEKAVSIKMLSGYIDTLAEAYYAAGLFQKAINTINKALDLDPKDKHLKKQLEKFLTAQKQSEG